MYDAAQALFNQLDAFQSIVLGYEKLVGELQIGVIDNTIFHPTFKLSNAIQKFGEIAHNVDISVHVAPPNQLEQMVIGGQVHLAIGFFPRRLSQLIYEPVFTSDMELFCGSKHPLFKMPTKKIGEAEVQSFPHAQRGYVSRDQLPDIERNLRFTARAHNIEGLAQLILSGDYIASLPTHYARQWVKSGEMRSIMPGKYRYTSVYNLIRRNSVARTPAEVRFHSILSGLSRNKGSTK